MRKLAMLNRVVQVEELRIPPNHRLEAHKGNRKGQWSIRISDQWRVCFRFSDGRAQDVEILLEEFLQPMGISACSNKLNESYRAPRRACRSSPKTREWLTRHPRYWPTLFARSVPCVQKSARQMPSGLCKQ